MLAARSDDGERSGEQNVEWRGQLARESAVRVDHDSLEEDLIELLLDPLGSFPIGASTVSCQIEGNGQVLFDDLEVKIGRRQLAGNVPQCRRYPVLFALQQLDRHGALVVCLHQLLALPLELLTLMTKLAQLCFRVRAGNLELLKQHLLDLLAEGWIERDLLVVLLDLRFDLLDEHGLLIAARAVPLPAEAYEVGVDVARLRPRHRYPEARPASSAVDAALQEVRMLARALAVHMRLEHILDGLPCPLVDQWLVSPGMIGPLELHDAGVVPVQKQLVQLCTGYRLGWHARGGDGGQSSIREILGQPGDGPVPRGVKLEGEPNERGAFFVENDCPDLATLAVDATHVAVAEGGLGHSPAVPRLLAHALQDFVRKVLRVELGDRGHDAVDQHSGGRLIDALRGGYEPDARARERPVDIDVVLTIAREPVELVHDHEVDLVLCDVLEHVLQLRTIGRLR